MMLGPFVFVVTMASCYSLMVCICVAGRMSKHTPHIKRFMITGLGFLSAWAILRTVAAEWQPLAGDAAHGVMVVIGAMALVYLPRIDTSPKRAHQ